jgi:hypothetical protein
MKQTCWNVDFFGIVKTNRLCTSSSSIETTRCWTKRAATL